MYFICNHSLASTCVQHAKTFAKHLQKNVLELLTSHGYAMNINMFYYLRQVNEVNGGDNAFVRCVSVCAQPVMGVKC